MQAISMLYRQLSYTTGFTSPAVRAEVSTVQKNKKGRFGGNKEKLSHGFNKRSTSLQKPILHFARFLPHASPVHPSLVIPHSTLNCHSAQVRSRVRKGAFPQKRCVSKKGRKCIWANGVVLKFDFGLIYRASLRTLFILAMREETERSMVRSPTSTTRPPIMSELTSLVTLSFLPAPTYWDLLTAASSLARVLLSRACCEFQLLAPESWIPFPQCFNHRFSGAFVPGQR